MSTVKIIGDLPGSYYMLSGHGHATLQVSEAEHVFVTKKITPSYYSDVVQVLMQGEGVVEKKGSDGFKFTVETMEDGGRKITLERKYPRFQKATSYFSPELDSE